MPVIKCYVCDKEFYRKRSQILRCTVSYCSKDCQYQARKSGKIIKCHICGKNTYRQTRHLKKHKHSFCSKKCSLLWQHSVFVGKKHPNWKTGKYSYRGI